MAVDVRTARAHAYENPRPEVVALVPPGARRILDLGCSSGALGAAIKARQTAEVVGIEIDADYARDATPRLDRVICSPLEGVSTDGLGTFDCLVAADVLEHLVDPWRELERFAALLEPGGRAVVSLPNVRHWETFWQLGRRGTWPTRSQGIFDRTHLRWFTLFDAYGLMDRAGLDVEEVVRVIRPRPEHPSGAQWLGRIPGVRPFVTFQHVLAGRRRT